MGEITFTLAHMSNITTESQSLGSHNGEQLVLIYWLEEREKENKCKQLIQCNWK